MQTDPLQMHHLQENGNPGKREAGMAAACLERDPVHEELSEIVLYLSVSNRASG